MFKKRPEAISGILNNIMISGGLADGLMKKRVIDMWDEVADELTVRYTTEKFIKNQTLYVRISHPVIRYELNMKRSALVTTLNQRVGTFVISEIRVL